MWFSLQRAIRKLGLPAFSLSGNALSFDVLGHNWNVSQTQIDLRLNSLRADLYGPIVPTRIKSPCERILSMCLNARPFRRPHRTIPTFHWLVNEPPLPIGDVTSTMRLWRVE